MKFCMMNRPALLGVTAVLVIAGCSNVSEEASTQTQRIRETEKETSEALTEMGAE